MSKGGRIYRASTNYLNRDSGNTGLHAEWAAEAAAELGSARLREKVCEAFDTFAARHCITYNDARILLLDTGVAL